MQKFKFEITTKVETTRTYTHEIEAKSYEDAEKVMKEIVKKTDFTNETTFLYSELDYENETENKKSATLYKIEDAASLWRTKRINLN